MGKGIKMKDVNGNEIFPCPYYPVGSIYMSVLNVNPSNYFGGTWEQIKDVFLLASGTKYKAGSTGGSATHTLKISEMPKHSHRQVGHTTANSGSYIGIRMVQMSSVNTANTTSIDGSEQTGGNEAHNNMPPYLAIYVWKRIK